MPADSILLFTLLLLATAAGWAGARWFAGRREQAAPEKLNPDYFKGLTYLLEDKPDKAIEVFVSLMEVDNETVETHFALGSLFRRRGEVDRAIRIHQNLIARPNLPREKRDQALHALAEDYLRAGLLDRAEKLFDRLVASPSLKSRALEKLTGIYEQQQDWSQAIDARQRLDTRSADNARIIAHYHCELAAGAMAEHDTATARAHLRKARASGDWQPRSALMRAEIALLDDDRKTAARLYRRTVESDSAFFAEVWPQLARCLDEGDGRGGLDSFLRGVIKKYPAAAADIAYAAIVHADLRSPVAVDCVRTLLRAAGPLRDALDALGALKDGEIAPQARLEDIRSALAALLAERSDYVCANCGYLSDRLYWQCPGCKRWDTMRPNTKLASVYLESGRSGTF